MIILNPVSRLCLVLLLSVSSLHAEILIGFAGPLTGPRAWSGQQFQRGAEQAVADINTLGGVLGQRLVLVVGDDASDERQAEAVANKLVADGVLLVIGHRSSDMTRVSAPIYAAAGVIQITPSSTNPALTEQPYAGLLAVATGIHTRTERSLHNWWLMLGIVGPSSGARLGNAWIGAWTGVTGRYGYNVPDNYGPSLPRLPAPL